MIQKITAGRAYIFNTSMNVVFKAKISGCPSVSLIKKAINCAVKKFDALNSRILQDNEGDFFFVKREEFREPKIEVRNYHQEVQEFINEQEKIEFDLEKGELIRFILELTEEEMTLNIVEHHLAGDGNSVLLLLSQIMKNVQVFSELGDEIDETEKSVPVKIFSEQYISKFVEVNPLVEMSIENLNSKWRKSFDKIFTSEDLHALFSKYWEKRETKVLTATIPLDSISAFLTKCKENGVSVNNAIITSVTRRLERKSKISVAVDLRTEEYNEYGNYSSCIYVENMYDANLEFWDNAKEVQQFVQSCTRDRKQLLLSFLLIGKFDKTLIDASYFQRIGSVKSSIVEEYYDMTGMKSDRNALVVSNLGKDRIREKYGKFKIEELSFFSPVSPGFKSNMAIVTLNEKMVINLQYNDDENVDFKGIFEDIIYLLTTCENEEQNLVMGNIL